MEKKIKYLKEKLEKITGTSILLKEFTNEQNKGMKDSAENEQIERARNVATSEQSTPEQKQKAKDFLDSLKNSAEDGGNSQFIEKMKSLFKGNYQTFVKNLSTIAGDKKTRAFLNYGLKDGTDQDDKFEVKEGSITASKLIPLQNEVDIEKSLKYWLQNPEQVAQALSSSIIKLGGNNLIIFNSKYIIDGHHRWSQTYVINPEAKMGVINMIKAGMKPAEALKATQIAIAAATGKLPVATTEGANLFSANRNEVLGYISKNMSEEVAQTFIKHGKGSNKEEVLEYLWTNVERMQNQNKPIAGAPPRGVMPQTDINTNAVMKELGKGIANSQEPFVKESKVIKKENYVYSPDKEHMYCVNLMYNPYGTGLTNKNDKIYFNDETTAKNFVEINKNPFIEYEGKTSLNESEETNLNEGIDFWRTRTNHFANSNNTGTRKVENIPTGKDEATNDEGVTFKVGETAMSYDGKEKIKIDGFYNSQNRIKAAYQEKYSGTEYYDIDGLKKIPNNITESKGFKTIYKRNV